MPYRVFISSVLERPRYQIFRNAAKEAVDELRDDGYDVVAVRLPENPPPDYHMYTPEEACNIAASTSHVYVGIYGPHYSEIVEKEYDIARASGKPSVIFKEKATVTNRQQKRFLRKVESYEEGRLRPNTFESRSTLKHQVYRIVGPVLENVYRHKAVRLPRKIGLSTTEATNLLNECNVISSTPTCVFLAGDWSVLVTKKAILAPCHLRVTVGITNVESDAQLVKVTVYKKENGTWTKNDIYSDRLEIKMEAVLGSNVGVVGLQKYIRKLRGKHLHIFSEVPFGSILHETAATMLCIAVTTIAEKDQDLAKDLKTLHTVRRMAAYLLSHWYKVVSWATICACSPTTNISERVLFFNRTKDGEIDFMKILSEEIGGEEYKRNIGLAPKTLQLEWMPFDLSRISVLFREPPKLDIPDLQITFKASLSQLVKAQLVKVVEDMYIAIKERQSYEKTGALMSLHQALLSVEGFSSPEYERLFEVIRANESSLGVKFSCSRGQGAVVVLHETGFKSVQIKGGCRFLAQGIRTCGKLRLIRPGRVRLR